MCPTDLGFSNNLLFKLYLLSIEARFSSQKPLVKKTSEYLCISNKFVSISYIHIMSQKHVFKNHID